jgi:hypothetical protein
VGEDVQSFAGWALGVYHFFRDEAVNVTSGIVAPEALVQARSTIPDRLISYFPERACGSPQTVCQTNQRGACRPAASRRR